MHLWRANDGTWLRTELPDDGLSLRASAEGLVLDPGVARDALAVLLPVTWRGAARAALLTPATGRVLTNGYPPLGLAVLAERDEVRILGPEQRETFYLGSGVPARVAPYPEEPSRPCARCKRPLRPGDPVSRCPACLAQHHEGPPVGESEALLCFSHAERCAQCDRPREEACWTPEALDDA